MRTIILLTCLFLTACNAMAVNPQFRATATALPEPTATLPEPTATAPATNTPLPFPQVCTGVVVAQTALNLRREPDLSAELVDPAVYLLAGDTVTLHQKSGDWWLVTYSPKGDNSATTNGWANAAYIKETGCK